MKKLRLQENLYNYLEQGDVDGMLQVIKRLFCSIPWRNFTNNNLAEYEGYYASVLYAFFSSLEAEVIPEDITNHWQVDMTVKLVLMAIATYLPPPIYGYIYKCLF